MSPSWMLRRHQTMANVRSPVWYVLIHLDSDPCIPVQVNFVQTIRAVELTLGIPISGMSLNGSTSSTNFTAALGDACSSPLINPQVTAAIQDAIPIILDIAFEYGLEDLFTSLPFKSDRSSLVTT